MALGVRVSEHQRGLGNPSVSEAAQSRMVDILLLGIISKISDCFRWIGVRNDEVGASFIATIGTRTRLPEKEERAPDGLL